MILQEHAAMHDKFRVLHEHLAVAQSRHLQQTISLKSFGRSDPLHFQWVIPDLESLLESLLTIDAKFWLGEALVSHVLRKISYMEEISLNLLSLFRTFYNVSY